jgi:hypothetical protein
MLKHIQIIPLIIGIVIGIIGILVIKPSKTVVLKYPTPDNCGKVTYKDKNGICYKYTSKKVECDKNEGKLKAYPLTN